MASSSELTCRACVWLARFKGGFACRYVPGEFHRRDSPACSAFEQRVSDDTLLVCGACGACCREAYHAVELSPRDSFRRLFPDRAVFEEGRWIIPRPTGRCVCLVGELGSFSCDRYAGRPKTCRDFEVGSLNCLEARKRVGLSAKRRESGEVGNG